MNNKGFSLVELLAVIVILAIIMSLGFVGFGSIHRASKEQMLKSKIESLETSAQKYGQERMNELNTSCKIGGKDYKFCKTVTVQTLLDSGDFESEESDKTGKKIVRNDVTNAQMNNDKVCIYKKNNRVYALMYAKFEATDRC